jgi:hypothetical protein
MELRSRSPDIASMLSSPLCVFVGVASTRLKFVVDADEDDDDGC